MAVNFVALAVKLTIAAQDVGFGCVFLHDEDHPKTVTRLVKEVKDVAERFEHGIENILGWALGGDQAHPYALQQRINDTLQYMFKEWARVLGGLMDCISTLRESDLLEVYRDLLPESLQPKHDVGEQVAALRRSAAELKWQVGLLESALQVTQQPLEDHVDDLEMIAEKVTSSRHPHGKSADPDRRGQIASFGTDHDQHLDAQSLESSGTCITSGGRLDNPTRTQNSQTYPIGRGKQKSPAQEGVRDSPDRTALKHLQSSSTGHAMAPPGDFDGGNESTRTPSCTVSPAVESQEVSKSPLEVSAGEPPLITAIQKGSLEDVRQLIRLGHPVEARAIESQHTALLEAVSCRRLDIVTELLQQGVSLTARGSNALTPLLLAATLGYAEIARRLLSKGASTRDTDPKGNLPIHLAAMSGDCDTVGYMIDFETPEEFYGNREINQQNHDKKRPLDVAIMAGNTDAARLLYESDARMVHPSTCMADAIASQKLEMVKFVLGSVGGWDDRKDGLSFRARALEMAMEATNVEIARYLLDLLPGKDMTSSKSHPLGRWVSLAAMEHANLQVIELVLERIAMEKGKPKDYMKVAFGSFIGQRTELLVHALPHLNGRDMSKKTPEFLTWCARRGAKGAEFASLWLERVESLNIPWPSAKDLKEPFKYALLGDRKEIAVMLVEIGAPTKFNALVGKTDQPLYLAAQNDRGKLVEALLNAGAEIEDRSADGRTALDIATEQVCPRAAEVLLRRGARYNTKEQFIPCTEKALYYGLADTLTALLKLGIPMAQIDLPSFRYASRVNSGVKDRLWRILSDPSRASTSKNADSVTDDDDDDDDDISCTSSASDQGSDNEQH